MVVISTAVVLGSNDDSVRTRIISIRWLSEPHPPGDEGKGNTIVHAECSVKIDANGKFTHFSGGEADVLGFNDRIAFGLRISGHVAELPSGELSVDVAVSQERRVLKEKQSESIVITGRSLRFVGAVATNEKQTCLAGGAERLEIHIDDK